MRWTDQRRLNFGPDPTRIWWWCIGTKLVPVNESKLLMSEQRALEGLQLKSLAVRLCSLVGHKSCWPPGVAASLLVRARDGRDGGQSCTRQSYCLVSAGCSSLDFRRRSCSKRLTPPDVGWSVVNIGQAHGCPAIMDPGQTSESRQTTSPPCHPCPSSHPGLFRDHTSCSRFLSLSPSFPLCLVCVTYISRQSPALHILGTRTHPLDPIRITTTTTTTDF
jgi:hypothetical protein